MPSGANQGKTVKGLLTLQRSQFVPDVKFWHCSQLPSASHCEWPLQLHRGQSTQNQFLAGQVSILTEPISLLSETPCRLPSIHLPEPRPVPSSHQPHRGSFWHERHVRCPFQGVRIYLQGISHNFLKVTTETSNYDDINLFPSLCMLFCGSTTSGTTRGTDQKENWSHVPRLKHMCPESHTTYNCVSEYRLRKTWKCHTRKTFDFVSRMKLSSSWQL